MKRILMTLGLAITVFAASAAFGHCQVPDRAVWHFTCDHESEDLDVTVRIFDDLDMRNCASVVDLKLVAEHPANNIDLSSIGDRPIYRHTESGQLEILVGFGSQNHFSVVLAEDRSGKGFIEFGGGPSWDLNCRYE